MSSAPRIALLTDSGTNVPPEKLEEYGIYCAYLHVNYHDAQYREILDISAEEVQARFAQEIPHTSTPSPQEVEDCVERAIADGCDHLLCVLTSSGLTSTYNVYASILATHPEVTAALIDTKSIGAGGGISVLYAAELIEAGTGWDELLQKVQDAVDHTHVYFLVDTLENLYRGGRINKAVYSLGSILDLKPVITCEEDGSYGVAAKTRGRKKALKKELELVRANIGDARRYRIGFATSATPDRKEIWQKVQAAFPAAEQMHDYGDVSPALAVHTGPGLVGVTVQVLE